MTEISVEERVERGECQQVLSRLRQRQVQHRPAVCPDLFRQLRPGHQNLLRRYPGFCFLSSSGQNHCFIACRGHIVQHVFNVICHVDISLTLAPCIYHIKPSGSSIRIGSKIVIKYWTLRTSGPPSEYGGLKPTTANYGLLN